MSSEEWASQPIPRDMWEHMLMPACQKIGTMLGIDPSTSAGRIMCLEHIFQMFLELPIEVIQKELEC